MAPPFLQDQPGSAEPVSRIKGIDAARALALIGMFMLHFAPAVSGPSLLVRLYSSPSGRASILFVLLAGLGVSLLAGDRGAARRQVVWRWSLVRAGLLLPAGLALQLLDHGVFVILQYYALLFLVAAAAVSLSDRALLGIALVGTVLAPVLYLGVRHWQPEWFTGHPAVITDPLPVIARDLVVSGGFPILTWSVPLLVGMWLGRQDLRLSLIRRRLLITGILVTLIAWGTSAVLVAWLGVPTVTPSWHQLVLNDPHSQMPLWLMGSMGSAVVVLGLALIAVDRWPRITWPLVAMGQLALTIYTVHLVSLALWPGMFRREELLWATVSLARFTILVALVAVLWRSLFSRGPLESALRLSWPRRVHDSG